MTVLNGTAANDILTGGDENDTLNGLSGADKMSGGGGDDVYVVDDKGDVVTSSPITASTRSIPPSPSRWAPISSIWPCWAAPSMAPGTR